jgi:type III secretory pathway component EscU
MRLLKVIVFFFIIYFIRRFFQMYKVMKEIQRSQDELRQKEAQKMQQEKAAGVVEADYKVMDP